MEEEVRDWNLFKRYLAFVRLYSCFDFYRLYMQTLFFFHLLCPYLSCVIAPIEKLYSKTLPLTKKWTTVLSIASCLAIISIFFSIIIPFGV